MRCDDLIVLQLRYIITEGWTPRSTPNTELGALVSVVKSKAPFSEPACRSCRRMRSTSAYHKNQQAAIHIAWHKDHEADVNFTVTRYDMVYVWLVYIYRMRPHNSIESDHSNMQANDSTWLYMFIKQNDSIVWEYAVYMYIYISLYKHVYIYIYIYI